MHEVFAAADSPTSQPDTSESRWQGHQERVRADLTRSKRLAARKNPLPKRTKPAAAPTATADAAELEKAKSLADERGKELSRLKKALSKSQAEVVRVSTELESTLEADVSKLETVRRLSLNSFGIPIVTFPFGFLGIGR